MSKKFISIQEASDMSGKSIQTIRRGIKSKKFKFKKQETPQGFNYLIDRESFCLSFGIEIKKEIEQDTISYEQDIKTSTEETSEVKSVEASTFVTLDHLKEFTGTLDRMIKQHSEERQNFVRLIGTLQEKIFVLENQVNILQAPKKKWFQVWK